MMPHGTDNETELAANQLANRPLMAHDEQGARAPTAVAERPTPSITQRVLPSGKGQFTPKRLRRLSILPHRASGTAVQRGDQFPGDRVVADALRCDAVGAVEMAHRRGVVRSAVLMPTHGRGPPLSLRCWVVCTRGCRPGGA